MFGKNSDEKIDGKDLKRYFESGPPVCGGTDSYRDQKAPKEIVSKDMTLFEAGTSLFTLVLPPDKDSSSRLWYISAYAAYADKGSFVYLSKSTECRGPAKSSWALVKRDVLPDLVRLVDEAGLARSNGCHSTTHGLPEDFGGRVFIKYASGESISFSNNQSPIIAYDTCVRMADLFESFMGEERVALKDLSGLKEIRFLEERDNGGFTKAILAFNADGTGTNRKSMRFDGPTVYESEKPVDAETMSKIKSVIERCGMLAWSGLPDSGFPKISKKSMSFVFDDGETFTAEDGKELPDAIGNGFFAIELEVTTKH